mmetsp:Transcript_18928/g.56169  ORF Transcript_18928/g.56169 Transcript_18928/m.56169 type:complete len:180 (+) Transcript_18928:1-540(+)
MEDLEARLPESLRKRLKKESHRPPPGGWGRLFRACSVARLPLQDIDKVDDAAAAAANAFDAGQLARNALVSYAHDEATRWSLRGRAGPTALAALRRAADLDVQSQAKGDAALNALAPAVAALVVRGEGSRVLSLAALAIVDAERLVVDAKDARAAALNRDVAAALVRALALAGELCGEA